MSHKWIKKGDKVVVIAGNDKGMSGEVLDKNKDRILIQGVNMRKKHLKQKDENSRADIISIERPIHISNVAFADKEGKPVRLKARFTASGQKEIYYEKNNATTLHRTIAKNKEK